MTDKITKAHNYLIQARTLMGELGYDETGLVIDQQAASSARLLARIVAEHKFQFREQIAVKHRNRQKPRIG